MKTSERKSKREHKGQSSATQNTPQSRIGDTNKQEMENWKRGQLFQIRAHGRHETLASLLHFGSGEALRLAPIGATEHHHHYYHHAASNTGHEPADRGRRHTEDDTTIFWEMLYENTLHEHKYGTIIQGMAGVLGFEGRHMHTVYILQYVYCICTEVSCKHEAD